MKPKRSIRRFDVFAEYQRLKGLGEGMKEDEAEGYGLWLAKLVASRRFGGAAKSAGKEKAGGKDDVEQLVDGKWRTLNDEAQTDEMFHEEIIARMGRDFYNEVFSPAIQAAFEKRQDYMVIRDSIRKEWKPESK